jgi:anti-anti-sigma regulatory factor
MRWPIGQTEVELADSVALVRLLGEHDLSTAAQLSEHLQVLAGEGLGLAIDLTETEFLDLAVLRALLDAETHLQGRRLVLELSPGTIAERLLGYSDLANSFTLTYNRASALAAAAAQEHE